MEFSIERALECNFIPIKGELTWPCPTSGLLCHASGVSRFFAGKYVVACNNNDVTIVYHAGCTCRLFKKLLDLDTQAVKSRCTQYTPQTPCRCQRLLRTLYVHFSESLSHLSSIRATSRLTTMTMDWLSTDCVPRRTSKAFGSRQ